MSSSKIENIVRLGREVQPERMLRVWGRHCRSSVQSVPFPHVSTGLAPSAGNIGCPCPRVVVQSLDTSEIKEYLTCLLRNWWYFCRHTHLLWESFNSLINDCSCLVPFITRKVGRKKETCESQSFSKNSYKMVGIAKADSNVVLIFIVCILIKIELQHQYNGVTCFHPFNVCLLKSLDFWFCFLRHTGKVILQAADIARY